MREKEVKAVLFDLELKHFGFKKYNFKDFKKNFGIAIEKDAIVTLKSLKKQRIKIALITNSTKLITTLILNHLNIKIPLCIISGL